MIITATLIVTVVLLLLPHYTQYFQFQLLIFNFSLLHPGNISQNLTFIALNSHENK